MRSPCALLPLILLLSLPVKAVDGAIEINQAKVDAEGGFPFGVSTPGRYVLTSDLVVPASTDGIRLLVDDVHLDLNGFQIRGPESCAPAACGGGGSAGVSAPLVLLGGDRTVVENGTVRGFGGSCLSLRAHVRVERLLVANCGDFGIDIGSHGIVRTNRVTEVGRSGIRMGTGSLYAHNTVSDAGTRTTEVAILGGRASAGNQCSDGSCSPRGLRRYYLKAGAITAAQAGTVCDPGFHVASVYELADPSGLYYDPFRGFQQGEVPGPPVDEAGWAHTGPANCSSFTSDVGVGTPIRLETDPAEQDVGPWNVGGALCATDQGVWCVED
ncbi:MAG: hypothetical protein QNK05_03905 [Myxococcota bacterium]|nr:hypothetical protein [Myxococcota bacterium]